MGKNSRDVWRNLMKKALGAKVVENTYWQHFVLSQAALD